MIFLHGGWRFAGGGGSYLVMRYPILFLLLALSLGAAPTQFDLPAQPVAVSLVAFAKQAGVEVLFASADLRDVRANAVNGRHEPEEALALLLRGTGFTASRNRAGKFVIVRDRAAAPLSMIEVRGSVVAADGGRPVADAEVWVAGSAERTRTGADGTFTVAAVPASADAALLIEAENFAPVRVTALGAQAGRAVALRPVRLAAAPVGDVALELGEISVNASELGAGLLALQKVVVTPSRFGLDEERGPLAATLTEADLQALPQLGEDVYRAISHLPGLAAQDTTARFWVRGAPNDRVLARLDGADLLEPFHLKDTASRVPLLAAVGPLQFEVLQFRMETEYNAETRREAAPFNSVRWLPVGTTSEALDALSLPTGSRFAFDQANHAVALFPSDWALGYFEKNHPTIPLAPEPPMKG